MMRLLLLLLILSEAAFAADQPLPDAAAEARAENLGAQLRCVVCQSESINDSQAGMAADLRALVRDKIAADWSDAEILSFMREKYGAFVLLKPPVEADTALLWLSPALFALLAAIIGFGFFRRGKKAKS